MSNFKVRESKPWVSTEEMTAYEKRMNETRLMMAFQFGSGQFDEREWITDVIKARKEKLEGLAFSFSRNSDLMNCSEVEAWKTAYNENSVSLDLHLRLYRVRFGEAFIFE